MNRRVTIAQINQLSNKQKFKPVKNFIIDSYLDGFKRRRQKNQKTSMIIFNYFTLCCLITTLIINIVVLVINPSHRWKLILVDISVMIGGIKMYNQMIIILLLIFGIVLNIEMRINSYDESIEVLQLLEMCRSKVRQVFMSRDPDENVILNRMVRATDFVYKLVTFVIVATGILVISIAAIVLIRHYTMELFVRSLLFQLVAIVGFGSMAIDAFVFGTLSIIITYYELMRINKINQMVERAHKNIGNGKVHQLVRQFTEQHNRFCLHIWTLNVVINKFYMAFLLTTMPINLLAQHQVLFESLKVHIKLGFILGIFLNDCCLFGLQAAYALVSKKIHLMNLKLSRLQWSLNGYPFRMRIKIKLLMCFERMSAKRKIGITMAGAAMTFPLFSKVNGLLKCVHF